MQVHNAVRKIEQEKRSRDALEKKKLEAERKKKELEQASRDQDLIDDQDIDEEDAVRHALVQDVIDEAKEYGYKLPPSVVRLLHHMKSKK